MPKTKRRAPGDARQGRRAKHRRKRRLGRALWRGTLLLLTLVALLLVAVLGAGYVGFRGPSRTIADLLTVSMLETSALKFVPRIYYSQEEVDEIVTRNSISEMEEETNTSLIVIAPPTPVPTATPVPTEVPEITPVPTATPTPAPTQPSSGECIRDEDGIQIYELKGGTYHGYMMVVQDPSRVSVGVSSDHYSSAAGLHLDEIAQKYDAVAAINGGAFSDPGGIGNGGQPKGVVISEGEFLHGTTAGSILNLVIGFTYDNILVFGKWSNEEAKQQDLRDAVSFGPVLVLNGEPMEPQGISSGLNPRTAIGQRSDGSVLMLVVEGRQAGSLGANYADIIQLMVDFGAVNAANLDGGSSSMLYYGGDYVSNGVVLTGSRKLPTAIIVR